MYEIESIIQKYFKGQTTEEENQQLNQWIQESQENKKQFFAEKDIWDTFGFHSNRKKYDIETELELHKNWVKSLSSQRNIKFGYFFKIAAMLLIAFGIGWSSQFVSNRKVAETAEVLMQEIFVPKGQVNQVFLADGTRIWINSETKLIAPSVFASSERVVKLNGEAFFEVAKDKKRPFRVEVNGQKIEVIGTSFNVRAYDNSNEIETTLETGEIRLQTGEQTTLLKPGEQSLFNKSKNKVTVNEVNTSTFSSWKEGRYVFQNEDLLEVFKVIERWYDVEIIADQAYFSGMHFSGVIKRNKDVKHFLEVLNITIPIKYEIVSGKIRISKK